MTSDLLTSVRAYADRNALLPRGVRVLVLVSGGPDSMCLMHVLRELHDGPIGVLTVDHGLRPESAAEVELVCAAAHALDLPVHVERPSLSPGSALQERARAARRTAAVAIARTHGYAHIATAHTASDQAETVLFRIARGTGRTGAAGMAPRDGAWIKPLLCATAEATRVWCRERDIAVVDDPSNRDLRWSRSRVRHELLPALERIHPGAAAATARFADQLRDEADALQPVIDAAWGRAAATHGLDCRLLAAEHPAIARLLVRRALADAGVAPDARWIDRALALARAGTGEVDAPGGRIGVAHGTLYAEPAPQPAPPEATLPIPGSATFGRLRLAATRDRAGDPAAHRVGVRVTGPLIVRAPAPGDRIALPAGGHQAVGKLLAGAGVPLARRPRVPVVVDAGRVVWVAGYRADPTLLAPPDAPATVLEVSPA